MDVNPYESPQNAGPRRPIVHWRHVAIGLAAVLDGVTLNVATFPNLGGGMAGGLAVIFGVSWITAVAIRTHSAVSE